MPWILLAFLVATLVLWTRHARFLRAALHRAWKEHDAVELDLQSARGWLLITIQIARRLRADRDRISAELDQAYAAAEEIARAQRVPGMLASGSMPDVEQSLLDATVHLSLVREQRDALAVELRAVTADRDALGEQYADLERIGGRAIDRSARHRLAIGRLRRCIRRLLTENAELTERQQEHLRLIANLSQSTPLADELQGWESQRAALIAEVGTLRARVTALMRDVEMHERAERAQAARSLRRRAALARIARYCRAQRIVGDAMTGAGIDLGSQVADRDAAIDAMTRRIAELMLRGGDVTNGELLDIAAAVDRGEVELPEVAEQEIVR